MKAMILAAGRGARMGALTDSTPKPLIRLAGKPLIEYTVEALVKGGFLHIVINHAYLGEQIVNYLGDGSQYGATIDYSAERQQLHTGGGVRQALSLLGDAPFVLINADVWTDYPLAQLRDCATNGAHLVLVDNPNHHNGDFVLDQHGLVHNDGLTSRLTFAGISVLNPAIFADFGGAFLLRDVLRHAVNQQLVTGEHYRGEWIDVGTPQRLLALEQQLTKK